MESIRSICQLVHGQRQKFNIKLRQPLSKATINQDFKLNQDLINIIAEETNVKEIIFENKKEDLAVILDINLNPELIAEGKYRDLVRSIQVLRREAGLEVKDKIKIFAPDWPELFKDQVLKKTLGVSIEKSDILKVEKV
jgi:isoleucyl-tRNA synthetase